MNSNSGADPAFVSSAMPTPSSQQAVSTEGFNPGESAFDLGGITDEQLLQRAVMYARPRRRGPRWTAIRDNFGLGSTYSARLCRRFGIDPDETVKR